MPEIKNQFTGGKMNKDVDERLVPKGEYRDAMNIQVATSEGSEVGTVQNILGNIQGCKWDAVQEGSFTVGSISDEKNDALYWLVSGQYSGVGDYDWNQFASVSDMILRKTSTECRYVFVDQYAFTIDNNTSLNFGSVPQISGLPVEVSSQIQPGWTVTGLTAGGDTSNTVEVSLVTPSAEYTANYGVGTINVADGFAVPLDGTTGTMGVNNNILYLAGYAPNITLAALTGQAVDLFDSSHPDFQTNTITNAQIVNYTIVSVQPFPQGPLFQNVSYIELTLQNAITPFVGSFFPQYTTGNTVLSSSYDGSIIWGSLTLPVVPNPITVPIPNNLINHTVGAALSVGDPVSFGFTTGCIGAINSANQFTLVNCSTAAPIAIDSGSFSFTLPLNTTIQLNTDLNLSSSFPLHESLVIEKPRVLNFNHGDYITGINIIDDMLFWTDGKTEPKKINISRSIEGTNHFYTNTSGLLTPEHTKLIVDGDEKGLIKEEHITVIRKAPLHPPYLEIKSTAGEGLTSGEDVVASGALFTDVSVGELITLVFTEIPDNPFGFKVGDIMLLSDNIDDLPDDWKVRVSIQNINSSGGTSTFVVKIETISPSLNATGVEWYGHLEKEPSLFQRKLPRFAYRYKYEDGEYSSFSPFTEVAFAPSGFNYEGTEAYNKGVINSTKSLKIQNFVQPNIPLDVVGIDLLYKNEIDPSIYLLKSISPNDVVMRGQTENYWNTAGNSSANNASKGSYEVSSDNVMLTLPSSQSLRAWDNVPKTAITQEITGNRVVYGNYTQGYDTVQPDIKAWLGSRDIDEDSNVGEKSIKSLRDYDIGVVWGDKYGRETPVKTSGSSGSIAVPKSKSINSSYINVDLKNSPDWAEYYRVYIKETSSEYYNLPADRIYDAADGNVWVSFPSVDRNKVDEDTYIILKKGPESDDMITEEARYKIVAIENEAPEYIKTTFERLVRTNTDGSKGAHSCHMYSGSTGNSVCTFPSGGNAPYPGRKGFSIDSEIWSEREHLTTPWPANHGMQLTSPRVLFDEVVQNNSGSTTDEMYVSFAKEEPDADGNMIPRYTDRYHVVSVEDQEVTQDNGLNYYYINLDKPIVSRDGFITEVVNLSNDNIHIHFWKKTIINKPEFDGRFFVKIKSDATVQGNLISPPSATDDLMVIDSFSLYKIADTDLSNFTPSTGSGKYLFHSTNLLVNAPPAVSTRSKSQWENLLKFGGSTRRSGWFIDSATFASRQNGTPPSSGKLSYSSVSTTITDGNSRTTCDVSSPVTDQEVVGLRYPPYLVGGSEAASITLADLDNIFGINIYSQNVGDGESNGQVAMRGVHTQGSGDNYIDIAYSQFGPDGPGSDGKTTDYDLDWRIGDPANSSTDQEDVVINNLNPETLFRVNGSSVIYKILGVHKFRLFNYHGAKRSGVAKVNKNVIPLHGTLWNTTHTAQVKKMRVKQNRRITYRIRYEASEVYSPDAYANSDALDKVGEPIAGITANNGSNEVIQFLTEFSVDKENPISINPAIFETEPKDDIDTDIYYEASSSLATLPLTDKNKHLFIPVGSTIVPPVGTDFPEGIFITSWESINPFSPQYIINLSTPLDLASDWSPLNSQPLVYVEKDNGEIVSFKIISGQMDPSNTVVLALEIEPEEEVGLSWFNCWSFNNGVESNRIGDTYNKPYITNGATVSSSTEELKEEETRKNGLIYSGIYNSTSGVNNLNQFIAAEKITKDINPIYGSIQKLYAGWGQGGDLVALCEDRVLKILANKDALYNADGDTNVTSTNNVLGQAIPYSGEYGISKNPESFASEAYRIYFTDKVRGAVMRLSMDGLTPISNHGMKDWFRDHLKLGDKLIGSYDDKKDEYNITIKGDTIAKTVTFREDVKGWVSFKSFTPENAISCANEYYTFKDGSIWRHHAEQYDAFGKEINRNTFYGTHNSNNYSTFTAVLNDLPGSVKSFNTINYEGSDSRVVVNLEDEQYYNLVPKPGWYVDSLITNKETGSLDEFIEKEGKWFNYIKGENIQHSLDQIIVNPDGSSTFDHASFAIQGVGRLSNPPVNTAVQGCTDPTAFNYDPSATIDNGSCIPFTYGCLHPSADNYDSNANTDSGNCAWTGCTCDAVTYPNGCTNTTTFPMEAVNYPLPNVMPTTLPLPGISDDGSCTALEYGCTDPTALNYNPAANTDDGSCTAMTNGCAAPTASNYDPSVSTDNGTCVWFGCMDATANNYYTTTESAAWIAAADNYTAFSSNHGLQPAVCTYNSGCTDPLAVANYDPTAVVDDGSCDYCAWPSNPSDIYTTTFTAETVDGAGDASIIVTINPIFTSYGFLTAGSGSTIELIDSSGTSIAIVSASGSTFDFNNLDDETYSLLFTQGASAFAPLQTIACTYSDNNTITIAAGPPAPVPGCTDCGTYWEGINPGCYCNDSSYCAGDGSSANNAGAFNYDPTADTDDGSCSYIPISGCTDPLAVANYDANASADDGSCDYCGLWATLMSDMFTVIVTNESVDGANDGAIEVQINSNFTDYGFGGPPFPINTCSDAADITLFDTSPNQTTNSQTANSCIGTLADGITLGGLQSNLPASDYDIVLHQGAGFLIGNQSVQDLCSWTMSAQGLPYITIAAGAQTTGSGCTDPAADNYDPNATIDDGSCTYPSSTLQIGDTFQGGIIAYFFNTGDIGYVPGEKHGIIVEYPDSSSSETWGDANHNVVGTNTIIGTGDTSTAAIMADSTTTASTAAYRADNLSIGLYTDWFLPSKDELVKIQNGIGNGATGTNSSGIPNNNIGGFSGANYWSSSQSSVDNAFVVFMPNGTTSSVIKTGIRSNRAARYF